MNQEMTTRKATMKSAHTSTAEDKKYIGFSPEERAAMKERLKEERATESKAEAESAALAVIDAMLEPDRILARRIYEIIKANAPTLSPKLWYGMPAYARDGNVVCFFQPAQKFNTRYATLGFNNSANLDEGNLWPVAFALKALTPTEEARIAALVKKAVR